MADEVISIIDENGVERFLGNIHAPLQYAWAVYGDTPETPMVARSEWQDRVNALPGGPACDWPHLTDRHDQDGIGMCNCSDTAGMLEATRKKQGLDYVPLSGGDLYHRISGGRDQGSTLEDALREAMANGIAPVSIVPYLDWQHNHPDAPAARQNYRVVLSFLCPTFDHCYSAVLEGFDLSTGIMWFNSDKCDGDGWIPSSGRGGGGHAIHGFKPTYRGSNYGIWHQQSWGKWGNFDNGQFVIPESRYKGGAVGGWWASRCVVDTDPFLPAPIA